jgi:hypothetical protein
MKKFVALTAVVGLLMSSSIAGAAGLAEITSSSGKVLVNTGKGFVPVVGMMSLNAGDAVMVGEGAQAQISYATGCTVTAEASSVMTIADAAPCQAGEVIGSVDSLFVTPTADVDYTPAAGLAFLPLLLVGTVVVGGGILVATGVLSDGGSGSDPVSAPAA